MCWLLSEGAHLVLKDHANADRKITGVNECTSYTIWKQCGARFNIGFVSALGSCQLIDRNCCQGCWHMHKIRITMNSIMELNKERRGLVTES